jgi:hypothetical protein
MVVNPLIEDWLVLGEVAEDGLMPTPGRLPAASRALAMDALQCHTIGTDIRPQDWLRQSTGEVSPVDR